MARVWAGGALRACAAWFLCAGGCSSEPGRDTGQDARPATALTKQTTPFAPARPGQIIPIESVTLACPGRVLVIPVAGPDGAGARDWLPPGVPAVTLDDGSPLSSRLVQIRVTALVADPTGWLPPAGSWSAQVWTPQMAAPVPALDAALVNAPCFWALVVDMPGSPRGGGLLIEGERALIHWVSPPPPRADITRSPRLEAEPNRLTVLGAMLRAERGDPLRRWRVALLTDRVRSAAMFGREQADLALADPVLEALAQQEEWRWRAAIAALSRADTALGAEVTARLTTLVTSPSGALLPVWSYDATALDSLRARLLDRGATDSDRLRGARAWLASLPNALVWGVDEGGPAGKGTDQITATIGVANLHGVQASASLALTGRPALDQKLVEGQACAVLSAALPLGRRASDPGLEALIVRTGETTSTTSVRVRAFAAVPPGLTLGPLYPPWDMASWQAGTPRTVASDRATAVLLERVGGGWEVYVECRRPTPRAVEESPEDAARQEAASSAGPTGAPPRDTVRLHLGSGATSRVISLSAPDPARTSWTDRWTARVAVPLEAIEAQWLLRIGVERIDADGVRSTWPRPVLPGQTEVPRAAVDVGRWGDLTGGELEQPASAGQAR